MTAYDLERLTPGGVKISHHEGKVETEGPWLILHPPAEDGTLDLLVAAHAVVELRPCDGRCRTDGGE